MPTWRRWAERLAATQWQEVHVYFMHEPTAPGYAAALLAAMGVRPSVLRPFVSVCLQVQ